MENWTEYCKILDKAFRYIPRNDEVMDCLLGCMFGDWFDEELGFRTGNKIFIQRFRQQ